MPPWLETALFVLLMASVAAGTVRRGWWGLSVALLVVMIVQDQHRFQPWAYLFGMAALAVATTTKARAAGLCRLYLVALYFHSGLSKLDASFCLELGPAFLETAARPFGMHPASWPGWARTAAVLAMPAAEVAIAAGLVFRRSRGFARAGAIGLHVSLIGVLGPWGIDQSAIVLVWNAALIVEVSILFAAEMGEESGAPRRFEPATAMIFALAAIVPFGERRGLCDAWPAFAYYASHVDRLEVEVSADDLDALPATLRRTATGEGPWRRVDLTAWSRAVRGVPVYPQARACLGLAEALAMREGGKGRVRVLWESRADRTTGRRERSVAVGLRAIRALGDRCRLNAHPAPGTADASQRWAGLLIRGEVAFHGGFHAMRLTRASGILLHPTSLPGRFGIGDLGPSASAFIEFLAESGQHWWQILPVGPTGYGNSPYQSLSSCAGNPLLISPELLADDGLLTREDWRDYPVFPEDFADFDAVAEAKDGLLRKAFARAGDGGPGFEAFRRSAASWLDDYALFMALKADHGGAAWYDWEPDLVTRRPEALETRRRELADVVRFEQFVQYLFARQWSAMRGLCRQHHIGLIGDLPIFVAQDSADVWSRP